jgi:release factor glutamine methyltransferase
MLLVKEAFAKALKSFEDKSILRPKFSIEIILAAILKVKRLDIYLYFLKELTVEEENLYNVYVKKRLTGEPIEYILGYVEFYDCILAITPKVLIPRIETEYLVSIIIKEMVGCDYTGKMVWDICCGSGCIGISLKKHLPTINVIMSDICQEALAVADNNCKKNGVQAVIRQGDMLMPFEGEKADFIICNPPYVSEEEYNVLSDEVKNFEPKKALIAGPRGLDFYDKLANNILKYLQPHGKVFLEIGYQQKEAVFELFKNGPWKRIEKIKDLSCHDRFFFLEVE